jgi:nitrite reductase/ring-hydroxylating ferredoxin subunit
MSLRPVARLEDLEPGQAICVSVDDVDIGLFRMGDDVFAMENSCPHAGHPLSEGRLEGAHIICAKHGWRYDVRSGFRPDHEDGWPIPCFDVVIRGDEICIDLERPNNLRRRRRPAAGPQGSSDD